MNRSTLSIVVGAAACGMAVPALADSVMLADCSQTFVGETGPNRLDHAAMGFAADCSIPAGGFSALWGQQNGTNTVSFALSHTAGGALTLTLSPFESAPPHPIPLPLSGVTSSHRPTPGSTIGPQAIVQQLSASGPFNTLTLVAKATAAGSSLSFSNLSFNADSLTEVGALDSGMTAPDMTGVNAPEGDGWHRQYVLGSTNLATCNWTLQGTLSGNCPGFVPGSVGFDVSGYDAAVAPTSVVPLPPAAWSGLATLAGMGALTVARRRRLA